jgi:hypothetical protein
VRRQMLRIADELPEPHASHWKAAVHQRAVIVKADQVGLSMVGFAPPYPLHGDVSEGYADNPRSGGMLLCLLYANRQKATRMP